jgi:selenium donor protein
MRPYLEDCFGNPSSSHWYGIEARKAVENARSNVAALLGALPEEIVFTSGGSEANNWAIKGSAFSSTKMRRRIITSTIEHPAVMEVCRWLETQDFGLSILPVDGYGMVDPEDLERLMGEDVALVSVMHANNEVGTIQPIRKLADIAHRYGALFHCDAAQTVGKIRVHVGELGVDLLSIAGHKLYAPKGIGALYIRTGVMLAKLMHGAGHERGLRAGTENVLEIVGLGAAAKLAAGEISARQNHTRELRDLLEKRLMALEPRPRLNGHPDMRLPNTLSIGFPGIEASTLLSELTEIAASAGAACHSDKVEISATLSAMKVPVEYAMGTIRFSTGAALTVDEVEIAAKLVGEALGRLKSQAAVSEDAESTADIRLTRYTHGLGCACKLAPQVLERILGHLPTSSDPAILVGTETSDDAAVYRIDEARAIVQTVDFFTPIVDDAYTFGAIAAANALSDIYAMGGTPRFALNIVGFPVGRLPLKILNEILRGAADKAKEAGVSIIGGHSIEDTEPKFGMTVTGFVDPARIYTNSGARDGDALVLTKPIGTGIVCTAMKHGNASAGAMGKAISVMLRLNRQAASILSTFDVGAVTDITGFGLLGHCREMALGSSMSMRIEASNVPYIEEAQDLVAQGMLPGGSKNNEALVQDVCDWSPGIPYSIKAILVDAQTSGGLLISVRENQAQALLAALHELDCPEAAIIGEVFSTTTGTPRIAVQ